MARVTAVVRSVEEMAKLGGRVARYAMSHADFQKTVNGQPGFVVFLNGMPGAGKTVFARGFVRECMNDLHVDVPSPTFCLSHEYWCREAAVPVHHVDLYRLESPSSEVLETIGIPTLFNDAMSLIEWPDRLKHSGILIPKNRLEVDIAVRDVGGSSMAAADDLFDHKTFEALEARERCVTVSADRDLPAPLMNLVSEFGAKS
jgi:tRNA threonylcarbamoyl adenosine modification protein YjeE